MLSHNTTIFFYSLTISAQSLVTCTNVIATTKNFIASSSIGASAHFTFFKSDFVSMTQGNYGCVEIANSKAPFFIVAIETVLIAHEIIDPKDRTTRTAISKLWLVYVRGHLG